MGFPRWPSRRVPSMYPGKSRIVKCGDFLFSFMDMNVQFYSTPD